MAKTMTKVQKAKVGQKEKEQTRDPNRYVRAARVLAKDDSIDVKTLADRAFMSETTAARCKEAWDAVIVALIEVGRLPDPAKAAVKKAAGEEAAQTARSATRRGRSNTVSRAEGHRCRHGGRGGILIRLFSKDMPPVARSGAFLWGLRTGLLPLGVIAIPKLERIPKQRASGMSGAL